MVKMMSNTAPTLISLVRKSPAANLPFPPPQRDDRGGCYS